MKIFKKTKLIRSVHLGLAAMLFLAGVMVLPGHSSAGSLSNSYIRLNRMKAGTDSTFRLVFKTSSAGATGLTIDFGSSWTGASGTVSGTQAFTGTTGCDASATALPSGTASGSGSVVTVTGLTALSATTVYCADFTTAAAVHTPTAGSYSPVITETGGATDTTTVAVSVVSNDQISVTATVPPTFNLAIGSCGGGGNTDTFTGNLSSTAVVSTTGCTVTVNTNAKNGWYAWATDANSGLLSASSSHTISSTTPGSSADLSGSTGTEGYVFAVNSLSQGGACVSTCGVTSAATAYDDTATHISKGSGLDGSMRQIASSDGVANGATLTVKERANIGATTPTGSDYTDTITVVGAGYF